MFSKRQNLLILQHTQPLPLSTVSTLRDPAKEGGSDINVHAAPFYCTDISEKTISKRL